MLKNLNKKPNKHSLTASLKECKESHANNKNNKPKENIHNGLKIKKTKTQPKSTWIICSSTMPKRT